MPEPEPKPMAEKPPPERPVMSQDQLADEKRAGRVAGIGTIVAAVTFAIGQILYQKANKGAPSTSKQAADALRFAHAHADSIASSQLVQGTGLVLMVFATTYLYRATKARWPQQNRIVLITGLIGPLALGIGTFAIAAATRNV